MENLIYCDSSSHYQATFETYPYNFVIVMQSLRVRRNFSRDVEADSYPKSPVSKENLKKIWEH